MGASTKKCPVPGCREEVPVNVAMCAAHWAEVPMAAVDAIFDANRRAYGPNGTPEACDELHQLIAAAAAAVPHN